VPKFVKEFGKVGEAIRAAIQAYAAEVRARTFPSPEHTYAVKEPERPAASKGKAKARTPA
jgi:3-methyl-2-oxobutanoate hydroxymethyltransferase